MHSKNTLPLLLAIILFSFSTRAGADNLKPYILGSSVPGTFAETIAAVRTSLENEGFDIAGEYDPYAGAHIIVVSSDTLKSDAALSEFGAYGAMQRVAITDVNGAVQVAYTNPQYFALAYRMKGDPSGTAAKLEHALGRVRDFGSGKGLSEKDLSKYHYMVMMPSFTDQVKLASFGSQDEALSAIEANLAEGKGACKKVYRIDIPGKDETVIGIGIGDGKGADESVMGTCDIGELKHSAHLPYELVVSDGTAYMLHGKFRIAVDFPDLKMMTFMKISGAPGGIEDSLKGLTRK